MSRPRPTPAWAIARELAGPILTAATAVSLMRVLAGSTWILPVVVAAAAGHVLAIVARRIPGGRATATVIGGIGLALTVTWARFWDTTRWWLPSGDTARTLADDLEEAWRDFGDLSPPVEPLNGFVVSAMAAVWLLAFVTDASAMRSRWRFGPLLLPIAAFAFVGLVGDHQHRMLTIGVFIAALLVFVTVHRVAADTAAAPWLGGQRRAASGRRALLRTGVAVAAVAIGGALVAGPVVGNHDDPVVSLSLERGRSLPKRIVISPLVDIRGRLVNQSDAVMFQVRSDERSYWRLTALDRFDGRVWTSRADYAGRPTQLPSLFRSGTSVQESVQQFRIEQLGAVWLPAAFEPRALVSATTEISYEPTSSTLIVGRSLTNSNGLTYTVTSALPRFDPEALRGLSPDGPGFTDAQIFSDAAAMSTAAVADSGSGALTGELADILTALPDDFSPRVRALAAQVTAGASPGYEQALALQDFFRNGTFTYDAAVMPGHSENRLEDFLTTRRGYCEQFAGAFAAMARSLSLPARVAVGFTVGEAHPDDPNLYVVRGRHAHAWPEVYLDGVGWVAFEPTPGRGAPGAQNYTGVAESQAIAGLEEFAAEEQPFDDATGPFEAPIDFESLIPPPFEALGDGTDSAPSPDGGTAATTWVIILVPSLVVLMMLLFPWIRRRQRRRRYGKLTGNRDRIRLLWAEAVESLALIRMIPRPDETHTEFARRAIAQVPLHSPDLRLLGELVAAASFAPTEPTERHQWLARTWSLSVRSEVDFRVSRRQRLAAAFALRSPVPDPPATEL